MIVPTTISLDRQAVIKSMSGFESSGDGSGMNDNKNRHIKGGTKDSKGREITIYEKRRGTARRMIRSSKRRQMRKCRTRILLRESKIGKHRSGMTRLPGSKNIQPLEHQQKKQCAAFRKAQGERGVGNTGMPLFFGHRFLTPLYYRGA